MEQAVVPADEADAPRLLVEQVLLDDDLGLGGVGRADRHEVLDGREFLERAAVR
jgi:hypothetical protein